MGSELRDAIECLLKACVARCLCEDEGYRDYNWHHEVESAAKELEFRLKLEEIK